MRSGEWTTYGDIAAAAGQPRSARAVGHVAATSPGFPNAHRVLRSDGRVSRGGDAASEKQARRLLEGEGVAFSPTGTADPRARIFWDELQRRTGRRPTALTAGDS